jgi:hypothetical protein
MPEPAALQPFGLLEGVDVEQDEMYTAQLKWDPLLKKNKVFWNSAEKDAADSGCSTDVYLAAL